MIAFIIYIIILRSRSESGTKNDNEMERFKTTHNNNQIKLEYILFKEPVQKLQTGLIFSSFHVKK